MRLSPADREAFVREDVRMNPRARSFRPPARPRPSRLASRAHQFNFLSALRPDLRGLLRGHCHASSPLCAIIPGREPTYLPDRCLPARDVSSLPRQASWMPRLVRRLLWLCGECCQRGIAGGPEWTPAKSPTPRVLTPTGNGVGRVQFPFDAWSRTSSSSYGTRPTRKPMSLNSSDE